MQLILSISILLLVLCTATQEPSDASRLVTNAALGRSPVETESRTQTERRMTAARRGADDARQASAHAAHMPEKMDKNAGAPSRPSPHAPGGAAAAPPADIHLAPPQGLPLTSDPVQPSPNRTQPQLAYNNPESLPALIGRTAIYDIAAHTVYLPDGERLEAHSGLGPMLDKPRFADVKGHGPTPPNVYDLTLRGGLFHGVRAIRLIPVLRDRMFGRDGILAHTYMLGPSGQSFGCVSFKHYEDFLRAFRSGEINRLVVVSHLGPELWVGGPPDARARQYAFNVSSRPRAKNRVPMRPA